MFLLLESLVLLLLSSHVGASNPIALTKTRNAFCIKIRIDYKAYSANYTYRILSSKAAITPGFVVVVRFNLFH